MKITLLAIGKTNFAYLREGILLYVERLQHYTSFEYKELPDVRNAKNLSQEQLKAQEGALILQTLGSNDELLLLDESGRQFSSVAFAGYLEKRLLYAQKPLVIVIGGAFGFSDKLYQRANDKLSLSPMTFSHQMVRLIAVEQLYRAFTIIKGEAYHHR
ncbi:MAG: 23S rRNA (pseudouridine(1915)-N(3))-methyltransferase RlmH [Bacteroidales bacterium]|nr:23S rRNA (pseudouridine(1915)-N(3))-methyltransferase RlmH [Bacteroidales bacterium]MCL2133477.1 23S rRNA (pseudouridine(1915)-N(3))-methyltransferase RlmH [Bacteroidales bacterium]